MTAFSFRIPGHAVGKGRPRLARGHGGVVTPKRTRSAERSAQLLALAARPRSWPLTAESYSVELDVFERRGAGGRRGPPPDVDNVVKLVLDALHGVAFDNDRRVDRIGATRVRTTGTPCVVVTVRHAVDAATWRDPTEAP